MGKDRSTYHRNEAEEKEPKEERAFDFDELEGESEVFEIIKRHRSVTDYHVYLSENVESNFQYVKLLDTLRTAGPHDTVTMYLANYGGICSTGFQIVNAMKQCKAGVDVIVDAPCYSMAAILAVSGKSMTMNPGTFLMFHNYSGGDQGKGKERLDATMHFYEHFHKHLKTIAAPFLTAKELNMLRKDQDIYIDYDDKDLQKRITRHWRK